MEQRKPRSLDEEAVACRFGGFALEPCSGTLRRPDGTTAALRPKTAELLRHLARRAGRVVTREEILQAVWPGVFVGDDSITQCVAEVRRELGNNGAKLLRTLPKRGYLLAAPPDDVAADAAANGAAAMPDRPSLAVLPFANLGGGPEQDYFTDGLAEELTTALSRIRWFFVVSRNSAFVYKGKAMDARQIGRELGVRYVLEGSVRRAGRRVRIACQLVAAETGHQVWSDRFEGDTADIFDFQDKVAEEVAGRVEPSLKQAEVERVRRKPTDSLDAYDLYLRSLPSFFKMTERGIEDALALLRRAIAQDPDFALAKAHAAHCLVQRISQGWANPGDREEGERLAREALATGGNDPLTLTAVAHALSVCACDRPGAIAAAKRALALNPNSPLVQNAAGWACLWAGEARTAVAYFTPAVRLHPSNADTACSSVGLSVASLMLEQPGEALAHAETAVREMPTMVIGHRVMIAALSLLRRKADAAAVAGWLLKEAPSAAHVWAEANRQRYADQAYVERLVGALRDARLPE